MNKQEAVHNKIEYNHVLYHMKHHLHTYWFILLMAILLLSCNHQEMAIDNLRCEYLKNPFAIENKAPMLSWEIRSDQRDKSQTAYRILVAGSPSLLKEGKADYWDSGIIHSSQSIQVAYRGKSLSSRQQLYWKVMVWDEKNRPIAWSKTATWSMGLLNPSDWTARWISNHEDAFPDSTQTDPAPFFRKIFKTGKPIKQAKAYVCGLGFYEMYLNGQKVGDQVMAPAVTNYDKRIINKILYAYDDQSTQQILYNTFDVTNLLSEGENTVGAILGNGWYNQRDRTVEGCLWYNTPRLLLQLEIEYTDGTQEIIQTDESWKCITGPLLHNGIFTGETYDARLEEKGWNQNNYNDKLWQSAVTVTAPTGKLRPQLAPYDQITRSIKPEFGGRINDSTYLYTLPEMIAGWAKLNVKGKEGDRIRLRFIGEEKEDFGQFDTYILKGGDTEQWEPRFTWHAFRSIEVTTQNVQMDRNSLTVQVVHTNPEKNGEFECSNALFNKLHEVYIRTQEANFHGSISSDCPHRERIAYTGDGQVVVESSILSFDMTQFYRKWFDDMQDARNKITGYVPHTAPFAGGGGGPAWGSAYIIMPWAYYCYYGDSTVLSAHYQGMKQWISYLKTRTDDRGIIVREEPNGWCLGDWCTPDNVEIPEPLVNTAYYYHCTDLMTKIATVLGKDTDHADFTQLAAQIKRDFNTVFFDAKTNHYWKGRQGSDVFPLAFGMVPEELQGCVFEAFLTHLEAIDYHFDTGILATPLLLKVLTENGRADIAYRIMNQREKPGFGYVMDNQYTCLWERWDGKASRCHPMFGSVIAWFYNTLAGIRFDDEIVGMKHIIIAPQPIADLTHSRGSYKSLYGIIRSEWNKSDKSFHLRVEIPANTTATIFLPNENNRPITESGIPIDQVKGVTLIKTDNQVSQIEIPSGTYHFSMEKE